MVAKIISQSRPTIGPEESRIVNDVLKSGQLAMGPMVSVFEEEFKRLTGTNYAIAVNSGTSGLHLALLALGAKPGTEVIIPSYACTSLLNAVQYTGAHPVIADIDPENLCISTNDVASRISSKTSAVIAVHTFGIPADINSLTCLGIPVIEDCAHSVGGFIKGKNMGSQGKAGVFSFYPTKMIATGEGGMVTTSSNRIARIIESLRVYDGRSRYQIRFNYKMNDISAALGLVQLRKLKNFVDKRRKIAKQYDEFFKSYKGISLLYRDYQSDVFYRYVVLLPDKRLAQGFMSAMSEEGIICDYPVVKPLHRYLHLSDNKYPGTLEICNRIVSIPIYPSLTNLETRRIFSKCRDILKRK